MPGPRQPVDLLLAKGKKHLSQREAAERRSGELKLPPPKTARPPKWLPEQHRKAFRALGKKLIQAGIYTDLDADALGRYLVAQHQYVLATEEAEAALQDKALEQADKWGRVQERYAKQARNHAADLGLTVTARCRLVIPNTGAAGAGEEENPFMQLLKGGRARDA